jgi:hypothetical protein
MAAISRRTDFARKTRCRPLYSFSRSSVTNRAMEGRRRALAYEATTPRRATARRQEPWAPCAGRWYPLPKKQPVSSHAESRSLYPNAKTFVSVTRPFAAPMQRHVYLVTWIRFQRQSPWCQQNTADATVYPPCPYEQGGRESACNTMAAFHEIVIELAVPPPMADCGGSWDGWCV